MQIPIYHLDAFTDQIFSGNPAAVCILEKWISDANLFAIAKENNLPATAFLVRLENIFQIRWITPDYELEICGHGTLAASYVILNILEPTWQAVTLQSRHESLLVLRNQDMITLNFPAKAVKPFSPPKWLAQGLGLTPMECYQYDNERCLAVLESEERVLELQPDMAILSHLEHRGIIVTAKSSNKNLDFVSRTFYPQKGISEDPVTGSSHCLLVPFWAERLNKKDLRARQVSQRGGNILCQYQDNRVLLTGKAVLYLKGVIEIHI